jgi:DNA-binding MarR family transcriptional regulator
MDDFIKRLDQKITLMFNTYSRLNTNKRSYGGTEPLYPNDIHMIETIAEHPLKNTTDISKIAGLTKGTVSKRLSRLEKLGFVEYFRGPQNDKEKYYKLTKVGNVAYQGHIDFHLKQHNSLYTNIENYSTDQKRVVENFIEGYIEYLNGLLKNVN